MSEDLQISYGAILRRALESFVHDVLRAVERDGLPAANAIRIGYITKAFGVKMPDELVSQFPDMIIIIIDQLFWELEVDDNGFSIELAFGTRVHKIYVPFSAIISMDDPKASFAISFHDAPMHVMDSGPIIKEIEDKSEKEPGMGKLLQFRNPKTTPRQIPQQPDVDDESDDEPDPPDDAVA